MRDPPPFLKKNHKDPPLFSTPVHLWKDLSLEVKFNICKGRIKHLFVRICLPIKMIFFTSTE